MLQAKPTLRQSHPPVMKLPSEILYLILSHLDQPRDLYHTSLVSKTWRVTAIDARLWEEHYWRFYRVGFPAAGSEQDHLLLERKEQRDHAAMRAWFTRASSSSLPLDSFSPFITRNAASGENSLYEPLARGLLPWLIKLDGELGGKLIEATFDYVEAEWKAHGPVDPSEATPRILAHLDTLFTPRPTPEERTYADSNFEEYLPGFRQLVSLSPAGAVPPPPFLQPSTAMASSLEFHALFATRMNADEQLLLDIFDHIQLQTGTLENMLRIVAQHGDGARDFLAALASEQRITRESVASFAPTTPGHDYDQPRMHALDVHTRAAAASSSPLSSSCLSLQHTARNILDHLQRRDAMHSLHALEERWSRLEDGQETLRLRVMRRCEALEEGIEALSLFGHTERGELRQYLDLLALFVWTNSHAYEALGRQKPGRASTASQSAALVKITSRTLMSHTINFLSSLNFGVAPEADLRDPANSFPNVALGSPVQRKTTSTVLMAIVCAVARRLGVAAALVDTPYITAAVVLEDGPEPSSWPGDSESQEWKRFFLVPSGTRDNFLAEVGVVRKCMSRRSDTSLDLEPACPVKMLVRAALQLPFTVGEAPSQPQDDATLGPNQDFSVHDCLTLPARAPRDDLAALSNYLSGHSSSPPLPLTPALLPSSIPALPSSHPRAPRDKSKAWRSETLGMVAWVIRLLEPSRAGGVERAEEQLTIACVGNRSIWADHRADLALLIEINGGDVAQALQVARQRAADGKEDESMEDEINEGPFGASSPALRRLIGQLLALDQLPCNGMGASGRVGPAQRDIEALRPRDESVPPSRRAQHSIGTVLRHRLHGYYGVVVGRESKGNAPESWMIEHGIDDLPGGGRNQPFYNVIVAHDASLRYFAQCNIEPLHVPHGSTRDDVVALLQELVPLLNLRSVSKMFRGVVVTPPPELGEQGGAGGREGEKGGAGGEVKLFLNEWMRGAWPYD